MAKNRSNEPDLFLTPRTPPPVAASTPAAAKPEDTRQLRPVTTEPAPESAGSGRAERPGPARGGDEQHAAPAEPTPASVKILVELMPPVPAPTATPAPAPTLPAVPEGPVSAPAVPPAEPDRQAIPARMLNEFVYCPRLFYHEFVDGVFVESADTLRGKMIHQRVDAGTGAMPAAKTRKKPGKSGAPPALVGDEVTSRSPSPPPVGDEVTSRVPAPEAAEPEIIHSRSVQMGSDRLGVVAKMDLVEVRAGLATRAGSADETAPASPDADLFTAQDVCPVDYKAGAPREGEEANELWDADKMQLGLQALILRDNGYTCHEGVIYYRATKQRVRLPVTPELEAWVLQKVAEARRVAAGAIPAPLVQSPKCVRCSLAPVCLPDETRMLAQAASRPEAQRGSLDGGEHQFSATGQAAIEPGNGEAPRRLMAARDDTRPLYLNTPGYRVGCSEEVLQVKDRDRVVDEVRIRDVSHVALFGNIQISTQAIQALCEQEVPVTYFSMGGWFYGITRGHSLKNVFLRMEQFRLGGDAATCLALARRFVHGKIRNHRTLLMRNHLEPPAGAIARLKQAADDALQAGSLEELLGIEGAAAGRYFEHFGGMIKVEDDDLPGLETPKDGKQLAFNFNFTNRNRRPPTDPVNAMLSLAYSLLAKDCTLAALAVGFDPYLGFYHQPRFGRPALALDLMEEMRPLVAESTVLSCINNRVVTEKDFVRAGQAVNLAPAGRKRFFQSYEQRMSSLITHPLFDYKVSYRRALELQARLLAKTLTGEIAEYVPLLTR